MSAQFPITSVSAKKKGGFVCVMGATVRMEDCKNSVSMAVFRYTTRSVQKAEKSVQVWRYAWLCLNF